MKKIILLILSFSLLISSSITQNNNLTDSNLESNKIEQVNSNEITDNLDDTWKSTDATTNSSCTWVYERVGAVCNDGWISSATGSGACSWHDGVYQWIYDWVCYY